MTPVIRIDPPGYHSAMPAAGALVLVALISVVAVAEALRAYDTPGTRAWRRRLELAALPLLAVSAIVVVARLAPLVR